MFGELKFGSECFYWFKSKIGRNLRNVLNRILAFHHVGQENAARIDNILDKRMVFIIVGRFWFVDAKWPCDRGSL